MKVVFGASGRAGGETARALLEAGEDVRVVVRRPEQGAPWKARGAEVALADLSDVEAVSAALVGAEAAFLLYPSPVAGDPFAQADAVAATLAEALRRTRLPKAVLLSSIGAQHADGTGIIATLHRVEAALAGATPSLAVLRPGYFLETWESVAGVAIANGVLPTFLHPEQPIPTQSTLDVGREAARLLGESWTGTRIVELSGVEDWTAGDVAAAFSSVLGRPVEPHFVPPEDRPAALAPAGLSPAVIQALLGLYDGLATGRVARSPGAEQRRGSVPLMQAVERIVAKAGGRAAA